MKTLTILLFFGLYLTGALAYGQYNSNFQIPENVEESTFYLDLSSGIDNHIGIIGLGVLIPISEMMALRGGAGVGAWGLKFSGSVKYGSRTENGWGFGLGYSHCPGLEGIELDYQNGASSQLLVLDYFQTGSLNFSVNYNFVLKREKIIFIETGYAVPTGGNNFYEITSGGPAPDGFDDLMQILRPGGLIAAVGLQIGF